MAVELRSSVKYGTVLSFTVLVLAYWFRSPQSVLDERLGAVLSSLLRAERKVGMRNMARPRVAIGEYTSLNISLLVLLFTFSALMARSLLFIYYIYCTSHFN